MTILKPTKVINYTSRPNWQTKISLFLVLNLLILMILQWLPAYATSTDTLMPPGSAHLFGTNEFGQDVLIGLLTATPNTIFVALATAFLSMIIAIIMAAIAALGGRYMSAIVMRLVDILQILPSVLILLLLTAWIHPGMIGIILLLALTSWYDDVRILRSLFLRALTRENIHYARHKGASWTYCIRKHIIPSIWPVLMGLYIQNIRQAAMQMAGLGFIGLTDSRLVSWGSMIQDATNYLYEQAWLWLLLPPAICLALFLYFILTLGKQLEQHSMATGEHI